MNRMNIAKFTRLWSLLILAHLVSDANATPEAAPQIQSNWYAPTLAENHDPICSNVLDTVKQLFYTRDDIAQAASYFARDPRSIPGLRALSLDDLPLQSFDPNVSPFVAKARPLDVDGSTLFIATQRFPGCGSACDTYSLLLSPLPLPPHLNHWEQPEASQLHASPGAETYQLYRSDKSYYYVAVYVDNEFKLVRATRDAEWVSACSIKTQPAESEYASALSKSALVEIESLLSAARALRRKPGNCGSSNPYGLQDALMRERLYAALYRPWAYSEETDAHRKVAAHLQNWARSGISEQQLYLDYQQQLAATTNAVAKFLRRNNHWSLDDATRIASAALSNAVYSGFYFDGAHEPQNVELRAAILDGRYVQEIGALSIDPAADKNASESLLSVAVVRPDVVQLLLERGFDPNQPNEFGKTPLMYAAQYDQLRSAEALLLAGAYPNAATIIPEDQCWYTIQTFDMTALHYAARYASKDMIELLLRYGALPYVRSSRGYPLDWLREYSESSTDKNAKIYARDLPELFDKLKIPSDAERERFSSSRTLEAEERYKSGETRVAYQYLRDALYAVRTNERALRDMSLVGIRANQLDQALEASEILRSSQDPKVRAESWHNYGLACERSKEHDYNGRLHCSQSLIHYALQEWSETHSVSAMDRLKSVFAIAANLRALDSEATNRSYALEAELPSDRGLRTNMLYIRHDLSDEIQASAMGYEIYSRRGGAERDIAYPEIVGHYELESFAVTVLSLKSPPANPLRINGVRYASEPRQVTY